MIYTYYVVSTVWPETKKYLFWWKAFYPFFQVSAGGYWSWASWTYFCSLPDRSVLRHLRSRLPAAVEERLQLSNGFCVFHWWSRAFVLHFSAEQDGKLFRSKVTKNSFKANFLIFRKTTKLPSQRRQKTNKVRLKHDQWMFHVVAVCSRMKLFVFIWKTSLVIEFPANFTFY